MELPQLLTLANNLTDGGDFALLKSKEVLDAILEYDKWKTLATFEHQLKLEEVRSSKRGGTSYVSKSTSSESELFSEDDKKFNVLTSYGVCDDRHLGLIAKTKIWEGANERASKLFEKWYFHIQENNILPIKDLKEGRIKTLLLCFLWANGCSHRIEKWPDSQDAYLIERLKSDLSERLNKFSKQSIVAAYESLKVFWKEINDYEQCPFNVTLIGSILDEAYEYTNQKQLEEDKNNIKNSPLFKGFHNEFSYVPLDVLEKYYVKNRYNFVAAGIGALRKVFTTTPPDELESKFSKSEWPKKWHQYIASYEPKWQKKLISIQQETSQQQEKWKAE